MFLADKTDDGKEPMWRNVFSFNTTLKIIGCNTFRDGDRQRVYQVLESGEGYRYQMSTKEFNRISNKIIDGKISGDFTLNVGRYPHVTLGDNDAN